MALVDPISPGPQPGDAPPRSYKPQGPNNGRPLSSVQPGGGAQPPTVKITSPGQVSTPPPLPAPAGFTQSWQGMHDKAAPQPIAELGTISINPYTGEWFNG